MRHAVTIPLFIFLLTVPAAAELTGIQLQEACNESDPQSSLGALCLSYASGLADGFRMGRASAEAKMPLCLPEAMTSGAQARLIIEKYMRDNPDKLHQSAAVVGSTALARAFRCSNSN
jgi:hypothetical protein